MNETWKAKIILALRSGEYKQAQARMRTDDGCYCVLGVIADVLGAQWRYSPLYGWFISGNNGEAYIYFLSEGILEKAGLSLGEQARLSVMNDRNASFYDIADKLEGGRI